ncbi:hypothetical protein [Arthrobacter nitrophenolicus]|uniref:Uncharacterized protein n=2 Tax=Arthrobacter nitrophenolicus TaxID=683150 RepID=L8TLR8_9MICC|nr:hypothetical protein [Arthrobacter nitrophenolicus]ELT43647.1 hypothetical protein G205_17189 [Arthrobacter nitrophenolicus]TDL38003.1 hypothetical protein E2R57_09760 [Arthrobacter nitrophenolicus]
MPSHKPRAPFHLLRSSALAAAILALAAGAHVAGGGHLPAPGILLAVLALTGLASTAATRLRLTFPAVGALLGAGQLALHEAFTAFSAPALALGPANLHSGHQHGGGTPVLPELVTVAGHAPAGDPGSAPLMLAAHALATLGCALLLAKGEDALWALAAWLRPLAGLPRAEAPDAVPPVFAVFPPAAVPRRPWRNLRQDSRRGPPSAVALCS